MSAWKVVYTEQAENDLHGIYEYIAFTLLEPEIDYLLFYLPIEDEEMVTIIRIMYGGRNIAKRI